MSQLPLLLKDPSNPGNFAAVLNVTSDPSQDGFKITLLKGTSMFFKSADVVDSVELTNSGTNQYYVTVKRGVFTVMQGDTVRHTEISTDYIDVTGISVTAVTGGDLLILNAPCANSSCTSWKSRENNGVLMMVTIFVSLGLIASVLIASRVAAVKVENKQDI
jgi:hypothetical protein